MDISPALWARLRYQRVLWDGRIRGRSDASASARVRRCHIHQFPLRDVRAALGNKIMEIDHRSDLVAASRRAVPLPQRRDGAGQRRRLGRTAGRRLPRGRDLSI